MVIYARGRGPLLRGRERLHEGSLRGIRCMLRCGVYFILVSPLLLLAPGFGAVLLFVAILGGVVLASPLVLLVLVAACTVTQSNLRRRVYQLYGGVLNKQLQLSQKQLSYGIFGVFSFWSAVALVAPFVFLAWLHMLVPLLMDGAFRWPSELEEHYLVPAFGLAAWYFALAWGARFALISPPDSGAGGPENTGQLRQFHGLKWLTWAAVMLVLGPVVALYGYGVWVLLNL